jgi:N6-L-threonylcarbamoyladenine synthase
MTIIGETQDDAAGEAFDKAAKIMGLPYPGGVLIDRLSKDGNENAYRFPHPHVPDYNFSFSGLKTAFLNFIKNHLQSDPDFIEQNKHNICASYQKTIVDILLEKLLKASCDLGINEIAISGGVSANSGLRKSLHDLGVKNGWNTYVAPLEFCTDNAGMIAIAGYYKYLNKDFASQSITPLARFPF